MVKILGTPPRVSLLEPSIESELFTFIIDQAAEIEIYVYAIGSAEDHLPNYANEIAHLFNRRMNAYNPD